jgi:hypothetical protein
LELIPPFLFLAIPRNRSLDGKSSIWKKAEMLYLEEGRDALKKDRRGSTSKGRPRRKYDPEDIDSVMGRLAYLEAENDFLKKLHALADSKEKKSTR